MGSTEKLSSCLVSVKIWIHGATGSADKGWRQVGVGSEEGAKRCTAVCIRSHFKERLMETNQQQQT